MKTIRKTVQRYLGEQIAINVVVNVVLALIIGGSMMGHLNSVPMQLSLAAPFDPSMGGDIFVGSFLLGFILTLIVTALTRSALRKGHIEAGEVAGWLEKLPLSLFKRALIIGALCAFTAGLGLVLTMLLLGLNPMQTWDYLILHAVYMGLLAWPVTHVVVRRALADYCAATQDSKNTQRVSPSHS